MTLFAVMCFGCFPPLLNDRFPLLSLSEYFFDFSAKIVIVFSIILSAFLSFSLLLCPVIKFLAVADHT